MRKFVTAVTAAAVLATAPAMASAAKAPAPAIETSLGQKGEGALFGMGDAGYVVAAVLAGLLIWGFVELVDDNESVSPD